MSLSTLLWGLTASSWLVPTWVPLAAAQNVVGLTAGVNQETGERPSRRNINDIYSEAGPHWDLLVQALDLFQKEDQDDVSSYYQISGIHGLPFLPWNGVEQVPGGANTGYCPHGQASFITWHRPYIALFEQILAGHAASVARQYPSNSSRVYQNAAETLRWPYWDWASNSAVPAAAGAKTVQYNGPAGLATIPNPLYSFRFPEFPFPSTGGFGGFLANFNETNRCSTTSGAGFGASDIDKASLVLADDAGQLTDKVYAVFTQSETFETMSTTANRGASLEDPHNMVHNDVSCISVQGRTGHMGSVIWSGFDPIFMLHHTNVDRLFAMWQAINYDDAFNWTQPSQAVFGTAAGQQTPDSPLKPFFTSDGTSFHTSRSAQNIRTFGYTYPEIKDWSVTPDQLAASVRSSVNSLYGGGVSGTSAARRRRRFGRAMNRRAASILDTTQYNAEISVNREELPLPVTIELYLSSDGSDGSDGNAVGRKVGSTDILAMPTTGKTYSVQPLNRALQTESQTGRIATSAFSNAGSVVAELQKSLRAVIKKDDGSEVSLDSVPSLAIEVTHRSYTPDFGSDEFPRYGPVTRVSVGPSVRKSS